MQFKIVVTIRETAVGCPVADHEFIYDAPDAGSAMAQLVAEASDLLAGHFDLQCEAAQPVGPEPTRRLRNYERDPFEDTSEGFLSNMAGDWANLRDRLAHQPEYCTSAIVNVVCPNCGTHMAQRKGQYGTFYACSACNTKLSAGTKKARKAMQFVRFCGCALAAGSTNTGVPLAYCPTHDKPNRYEIHTQWGSDLQAAA